jgi:hypothetical protein
VLLACREAALDVLSEQDVVCRISVRGLDAPTRLKAYGQYSSGPVVSERNHMKRLTFFPMQHLRLGGAGATTFALLGAAGLWLFASKAALAQNSVQRDQQALAILAQTIAAAGGRYLIASLQDVTETGTATFHLEQEVTGSVSVKERGLHQIKVDADLPEGRRSTVVNGAGGSLTEPDGQFRPINRQICADLGSLTFPYLPVLEAIDDSSITVIDGGLVTYNGASVHKIRIEKAYTSQHDPIGNRGALEGRDIYIDPSALMVVSISDQIHFGRQPENGIFHEMLFSNYRIQNGVPMPMTISERMQGVTSVTLQLDHVAFNSGLTDADFRHEKN